MKFFIIAIAYLSLECYSGFAEEIESISSDKETSIKREIAQSTAAANNAKSEPEVFELATRFASRVGHDALPYLVDALMHYESNRETENSLTFIQRTIVELADPDDTYGIRSSKCWLYWKTATQATIIAISKLDDNEARETLIRLATGKYSDKAIVFEPASLIACGLLRSFELEQLSSQQIDDLLNDQPAVQRANLQALLSSLKYRDSLEETKDREAYIQFEKALWQTWGLTPPDFSRPSGLEYGNAAAALRKAVGEIEERFILRIFEDSESTGVETRIAINLACQLSSPTLKERLIAIADSKSPKAEAARRALQEMTSGNITGMPGEDVDSEKRP